uniref:Uncharacterized protein n=1 Tax=viral metagenome TaxID=1070528 RepID=A0A6C0BMS0_9ZZZZ
MASLAKVPMIAILGLFAFLMIGGLLSKRGSVCGRGWLAFLMLPLAAAVVYSLFTGWLNPPEPLFNQADIQDAVQRFGAQAATKAGKTAVAKYLKKGLAKKTGGGSLARAKSMLGYALFLAFFQYVATALVVMIQKPDVPKNMIFKRSFIAAGISFLFSIGFIIAFTIISNVIPVVKSVLMVAQNLPVVGRLMNDNIYYAIALSPLHMLGALAAHGIACSFMNAPPPAPAGAEGDDQAP